MKSPSKSKKVQTISLTKIKQWYLPVDAASYNILKAAGVPLIRFHENFIPTLSLITKPRGIKGKLVDFNDAILHPYLDKLGELWQRKEHRKASITGSVLKFETTHASIQAASKEALQKVEISLRRFFTRWGYAAVFEYSESRGKCKLHVDYKYDSNRMPVIPLVEDPTSLPTIRLKLGFIRVSITLGEKEVETNIAIAAGAGWNSLHTSRCLYDQVSDVRPMVSALMQIVNKDQHNFESRESDTSAGPKLNSVPLIVEPVRNHESKEIWHTIDTGTLDKGGMPVYSKIMAPNPVLTGYAENISGDTTNIRGDTKFITGDVSSISGDVSNLKGVISAIRGNVTNLSGDVTFLCGNVSTIKGTVNELRGDVTSINGDVSLLRGDISNITGKVTGIQGDVSALRGDVSGISINK